MTVRFYVNASKPEAVARREEFVALARQSGLIESDSPEIILALGGDGTLLRAVHEFPETPVLGLNLGGLGYLAAVGVEEIPHAFDQLARGAFTVSKRSLIEVNGKFRALNDIVITRELSGHSTRLDLRADGRLVTSYMADGLIFATPTGSTAYSLAAGGPVLLPDSGCVVITPMNPHALSVRPLVLSDKVSFTVTACARTAGNVHSVGVYADGENVLRLGEGESVEIRRSAATAKLIELEGYDPYVVLARKLGWSGLPQTGRNMV